LGWMTLATESCSRGMKVIRGGDGDRDGVCQQNSDRMPLDCWRMQRVPGCQHKYPPLHRLAVCPVSLSLPALLPQTCVTPGCHPVTKTV
jgi:hypothetical protein